MTASSKHQEKLKVIFTDLDKLYDKRNHDQQSHWDYFYYEAFKFIRYDHPDAFSDSLISYAETNPTNDIKNIQYWLANYLISQEYKEDAKKLLNSYKNNSDSASTKSVISAFLFVVDAFSVIGVLIGCDLKFWGQFGVFVGGFAIGTCFYMIGKIMDKESKALMKKADSIEHFSSQEPGVTSQISLFSLDKDTNQDQKQDQGLGKKK